MASCMSEKQLQQNNNETMDTSDDEDDALKDTELEEEPDKTQYQHNEENFNFPVIWFYLDVI